MSVRMPRDIARLARGGTPASNLSPFEAEALSESASSLGYHGRKVETLLTALENANPQARKQAIADASEAVWAYFIQRELCGMRDHRQIIKEMHIPGAVLTQLGATATRKS